MENFESWLISETEKRKAVLKKGMDSSIKSDLFETGCAKVESLLTSSDVRELIDFQRRAEKSLGERLFCSGYVNVHDESCEHVDITHVRPNYGQVRLQTKGIRFPMPGFSQVAANSTIREVFDWYHESHSPITRGTMEWIVPADLNHNGWHKDMLRPQLKSFTFLDEVDVQCAPMSFALNSHMNSNAYEIEVSRRLSVLGTHNKDQTRTRAGKNYPAVAGAHTGYLGDDESYNDGDNLVDGTVEIGGVTYERVLCTGKPGDVCFFDSSGFHSGNKVVGKNIRRTITISSPTNDACISRSLDKMGIKTA